MRGTIVLHFQVRIFLVLVTNHVGKPRMWYRGLSNLVVAALNRYGAAATKQIVALRELGIQEKYFNCSNPLSQRWSWGFESGRHLQNKQES